ncbi:uncharacterized protein LOC125090783 [Lutra lutra]|uniref:uncharacterized protein LOC125090783 n=1 Tax=Lutra lutra TaxID=9657 RepID=UPI001FD1CD79|nr:uncharacterized protein LOC125090783 [Lutra lutra]
MTALSQLNQKLREERLCSSHAPPGLVGSPLLRLLQAGACARGLACVTKKASVEQSALPLFAAGLPVFPEPADPLQEGGSQELLCKQLLPRETPAWCPTCSSPPGFCLDRAHRIRPSKWTDDPTDADMESSTAPWKALLGACCKRGLCFGHSVASPGPASFSKHGFSSTSLLAALKNSVWTERYGTFVGSQRCLTRSSNLRVGRDLTCCFQTLRPQ